MKNRAILFMAIVFCLTALWKSAPAQDQPARRITKADFIKVESGSLDDRIDRAFRQAKSAGQTAWLAWHFRARQGVSYSPFGSMNYYDNGIRLEKRDSAEAAALFLLVDTSGAAPKFQRLTLLNLDDPYVFEDRNVYWLGDIETGQSLDYLEKTFLTAASGRDLSRGALRAISVHEGDRPVSMLRKAAGGDGDLEIRRAAVSGLARVGSTDAAEALVSLYDSASEIEIKREVINAMSRSRDRRAAEKLTSIAINDPDPKMRQRAIQRLSSRNTRL